MVKALSRSGLGPTPIGMWRCALGAMLIFGAAAVCRNNLRVPRQAMGLLLLAGLAFATDLFVWHRSIVLAGAGLATILANTQVFVTALLSAVFFGEPLRFRFAVIAAIAMFGVTLLVGAGSDVAFSADYLRGVGYGLATGVVYGVFLVFLRAAGRRSGSVSSLAPLAWFSLYAAVFLAAATGLEPGVIAPPSAAAWGLLLVLALISHSLGWWAISRSLVQVRGATGGLLLLLQPVLATGWAALVFEERFEPLQILGALVTIGAIYVGSARA